MRKVYLGPALGLIGARAVIVTFYFKLIRALLAFCGAEYSVCWLNDIACFRDNSKPLA